MRDQARRWGGIGPVRGESSSRDHFDAVLGDNRDMPNPRLFCAKSSIDERFHVLGNGRKSPKQNNSATFKGNRPLKGDRRSCPNNVVTLLAQTLDNRTRKVFIRQNSHSGGDWVSLIFVG